MNLRTWGAAVVAVVAGWAAPAFAGPDFVTDDRGQQLSASDERRELSPTDDLVFMYDSSALLPTPQAQVASAARWLHSHPGYRIVVAGHADSAGTPDHNEALATRRADIVRNHLIASGIAADRIVVVVYGENRSERRASWLDRRVVLYATRAPLRAIVDAELDHAALAAVWTRGSIKFRESRGITPLTTAGAIATRR